MRLPSSSDQQAACTLEIIGWLHECFVHQEQSQPLQPNPFYERNDLLTPEVVEKVLGSIEDIFEKEIKNYPGYHNNAQGISAGEILTPPGFNKLPYSQQLAIVQGIDRIALKYQPEPSVTETPIYDGSY